MVRVGSAVAQPNGRDDGQAQILYAFEKGGKNFWSFGRY